MSAGESKQSHDAQTGTIAPIQAPWYKRLLREIMPAGYAGILGVVFAAGLMQKRNIPFWKSVAICSGGAAGATASFLGLRFGLEETNFMSRPYSNVVCAFVVGGAVGSYITGMHPIMHAFGVASVPMGMAIVDGVFEHLWGKAPETPDISPLKIMQQLFPSNDDDEDPPPLDDADLLQPSYMQEHGASLSDGSTAQRRSAAYTRQLRVQMREAWVQKFQRVNPGLEVTEELILRYYREPHGWEEAEIPEMLSKLLGWDEADEHMYNVEFRAATVQDLLHAANSCETLSHHDVTATREWLTGSRGNLGLFFARQIRQARAEASPSEWAQFTQEMTRLGSNGAALLEIIESACADDDDWQ